MLREKPPCVTLVSFRSNPKSPVRKMEAYLEGPLYFDKVSCTELVFKRGRAVVFFRSLWPRLGPLVQPRCSTPATHPVFASFQKPSTISVVFLLQRVSLKRNPT